MMSHGRRDASRQKDWRRAQYENLKKTKQLDPVQPFKPMTGFHLKPGWVTTAIVLNVLFAASREVFAEAAPLSGKVDIKQLALSKLKNDPDLSASRARAIDCSRIPSHMATLASKNSEADAIIRKLLISSELVIYCSDTETIKTKTEGQAYFKIQDNSITFDAELADETTALHELTHAHFFFLQQSNPNPVRSKTAGMYVSPLLQVRAEDAKQYMSLLDKGYQRILEMDKLLVMQRNHKSMTKQQIDKLREYLDATKKCLLTTNRSKITHDELAMLGAQGYLNGRIFSNADIDGTTLKIVKYVENKNDATIYALVQEPHYSLISLMKLINKQRKAGGFADIFIESAEYDAYSFMALDETAIKLFFPEAKAKRDEMIKVCDEERDNRNIRSEL